MKYLENLTLENLSSSLCNRELGGGLILNGRVEVYSTKRSGDDKKKSKRLATKIFDVADFSNVSSDEYVNAPNKVTKKLLVDLIQTLNASSVDYDFSELSHNSFVQIGLNEATQNINSRLAEFGAQNGCFIGTMWREIGKCMGETMTQCEVYTLSNGTVLDEEEDESSVWNFNYFFCSKELKRICYFKCIATSKFRKHHLTVGSGGNLIQTEDEYDEADVLDESMMNERNEDEDFESDGEWN